MCESEGLSYAIGVKEPREDIRYVAQTSSNALVKLKMEMTAAIMVRITGKIDPEKIISYCYSVHNQPKAFHLSQDKFKVFTIMYTSLPTVP